MTWISEENNRHLAVAYTAYALFQNAQAVALSLVWGMHAVVLILLGFWRRLQGLRWFGLFLSLVIFKVFLYDLLIFPRRTESSLLWHWESFYWVSHGCIKAINIFL